MSQPSTPWYNKPVRVNLLLFFFFPVGLYGLWKSAKIAMWWKVLGTLLISALVISVARTPAPAPAAYASRDERPEAAATPAPESRVTISSTALATRYAENEVKADQDFKGQYLYVSGTVSGIKKDMFDKIYVTLATDNEFMPTWCYLDDEAAAAALQTGQHIVIKGKCTGMIIGSVQLKDCELAK
jgi:hypothetical protein